jgi:hypothetical protein
MLTRDAFFGLFRPFTVFVVQNVRAAFYIVAAHEKALLLGLLLFSAP